MDREQRKLETDTYVGAGELLGTFRGNRKAAVEAATRFTHEHPRIQKKLAPSTIYQALQGEPAWEQTCHALVDLQMHVSANPREYCEPPAIPEDWPAFRKMARDYATSEFWFTALGLDDLVKETTFRSSLSRDTAPRDWFEIRERAVKWRVRVLQALDAWEYRTSARSKAYAAKHLNGLDQTWVRDALDSFGQDVAREVLTIVRRGNAGDWVEAIHCFDPADPNRSTMTWGEYSKAPDVAQEFEAMMQAGFPDYVENVPQEREPDVVQGWKEWVTEDCEAEYNALTEFENTYRWDPFLRQLVKHSKPVRKQVWFDPQFADDGEEVHRKWVGSKIEKQEEQFEDGSTGGIVDVRVDQFVDYVLRWRPVDEYDVTWVDGLRERERRAGARGEDDMSGFRRSHPPIERPTPERPARGYTRD